MILGYVPIPKGLVIPELVKRDSRDSDLTPRNGLSVPFGADCWLATRQAVPHEDDSYQGSYFLTLSIQSRHRVGDAKACDPGLYVPAGTLFVIDPRVVHWLFAVDAQEANAWRSWIGVQWEVSRRGAKAKAREIMMDYKGSWNQGIEGRYRSWLPEE